MATTQDSSGFDLPESSSKDDSESDSKGFSWDDVLKSLRGNSSLTVELSQRKSGDVVFLYGGDYIQAQLERYEKGIEVKITQSKRKSREDLIDNVDDDYSVEKVSYASNIYRIQGDNNDKDLWKTAAKSVESKEEDN